MTYNLYDAKGSCQLCSSSTVQRRVDSSEYRGHAERHVEAGDPVIVINSTFQIVHAEVKEQVK